MDWSALGRLLLAALLGGLLGAERELSGKPAGLRTNVLICLGSALLMELSIAVARAAGVGADPGRIAAQIVSGIGFIGAGTILHARGSVIGLTTAATLWVGAAIGMAVGAGALLLATAGTLLAVLTLVGLRALDTTLGQRRRRRRFALRYDPRQLALAEVRQTFQAHGVACDVVALERQPDAEEVVLDLRGAASRQEAAMAALLARPGVRGWRRAP